MLRRTGGQPRSMAPLESILAAATIDNFLSTPDLPAVDKTIAELDLRGKTGGTIIAIVRDDKPRTNPPPEMKIETGDILVLFGSHAELDAAVNALQPARAPSHE